MRNSMSVWRSPSAVTTFSDLFDDLFERSVPDFSGYSGTQMLFKPACDIEETETHYLVTAELPGVKKEDVKVELHNQELLISAQRKKEKDTKESAVHLREREYGEFRRVFGLPIQVDAAKVEAAFENGELTVVVPKAETAKPRQIQIGEGKTNIFSKLLNKDKETEKSAPKSVA